jgi:lysophospholipase L1-like esterase
MTVGRLAASLGLVITLVAAACSSGPTGPTVAVIGDSITFLSATPIRAGLRADNHRVLLTGRIGYTAAQLAPDVAQFATHHPRVVLFELGTNDVTQSYTGASSAAAFEQVMAGYLHQFPGACLIATTVSSHRPFASMNRTAVAINAWIRANFTHVIDWDGYEWAQRQQGHAIVDGDLVHPNPEGQQDLANLDQAAVRACKVT